jgi:hypothetical protein
VNIHEKNNVYGNSVDCDISVVTLIFDFYTDFLLNVDLKRRETEF